MSAKEWIARVRTQSSAVDHAIFDTVEATQTPLLDRFPVRLSDAATDSRPLVAHRRRCCRNGRGTGRRPAKQSRRSVWPP
jgi:hypothetical protein